jgi:hypothetical protein
MHKKSIPLPLVRLSLLLSTITVSILSTDTRTPNLILIVHVLRKDVWDL